MTSYFLPAPEVSEVPLPAGQTSEVLVAEELAARTFSGDNASVSVLKLDCIEAFVLEVVMGTAGKAI